MESDAHKDLKQRAKAWLILEHGFREDEIEEEYQVYADETYYLVDIVGIREEFQVAVECGKICGSSERRQRKREFLENHFDVFRRMSYLFTHKTRSVGDTKFERAPQPHRPDQILKTAGEEASCDKVNLTYPTFSAEAEDVKGRKSDRIILSPDVTGPNGEVIEPGDTVTFRVVKVEKRES